MRKEYGTELSTSVPLRVVKLLGLCVEVQVLLGALAQAERELLLGDVHADALSAQPVSILEL